MCEDSFVLCNEEAASVEKILKNIDVAKAFRIDQISAKFLKDGVLLISLTFC